MRDDVVAIFAAMIIGLVTVSVVALTQMRAVALHCHDQARQTEVEADKQ